MKNLCPMSALPCEKDCILFVPKGTYKKEDGSDYEQHCGKYGVKFPIQEAV